MRKNCHCASMQWSVVRHTTDTAEMKCLISRTMAAVFLVSAASNYSQMVLSEAGEHP